MLRNTDDSSSLLSARLAKKDDAKKSPIAKQVDVRGLRGKAEGPVEAPTYATNRESFTPYPLTQEKAPKKKKEKRQKKKKLLQDTVETAVPSPAESEPSTEPETAEDLDAFMNEEDFKTIQHEERTAALKGKAKRVFLAVTVVLCLYLAFLIYGLLQTNYIYNDNGEVVPEILSVEDLGTLNQYNTLSNYYLRVRILYEKVLTVDYKLAQNSDNGALVAMEYTDLLDNVSKLITDIEAAQLDTAYTILLNQMDELVKTHIAVYLQNMAKALTQNDSDAATQALAGREVIESEFTALTANMATLCNATNGANNGEIYSWSPAGFMESLAQEVP